MHRLAFVCLVLAGLFLPVSHADASTRICKVTYLGSHERQRLRAAMQAVLPEGVCANNVPTICGDPSYFMARLSAVPRLRSDGVTEWWTVRCDRVAREWICDGPSHRQLIWVFAEVGGVLRRLEVTFGDSIALARACTISVQAVNILLDPSSLPGTDTRGEWQKVRHDFSVKQADTVNVQSNGT